MYIPKINRMSDQTEIIAFMRQYSFATIITAKDGYPVATPLPFSIAVTDDKVTLTAHFAKANPQWQDIEAHPVLVIFSEPHAYISTKHYDQPLNVPTWNYVSVHAYGKGRLITDSVEVMEVLEAMIRHYEPDYQKDWEKFPDTYKSNMAKGIVAFEIEVTQWEGKKKISQNRSETEKERIIHSLSQSNHSSEKLIAEYMRREQG